MKRLAMGPLTMLFILTASATAGPEKVAFPAYQTHVLYEVLDQPDIKELREAYINLEAFKALKPGQPLPNGTVLSLPTFKALVNDKGELVKDPNGRLVRGRLDRIVVMEKRTGWGVEYPEDLRNGEWEYARFLPDGTRDPRANIKGCFECHKPESARDFVFTLPQLLEAARRQLGQH
ncbi:MAG TPA: cytochrome P460 family protein [Methylomirabilota bacterium]|nr:cytochrome P460 family protein [Methylomirabilota bacterium]